MTPLLTVHGLRVTLPSPAGPITVVDGVDFQVSEGQVVGIAGESGSGKTISMLALLGLLPQGSTVEGTVRFRDTDLVTLSERAMRDIRGRSIAVILQDPVTSLHPMLTVESQLTEHMRRHLGVDRRMARARAI